MPAMKNGVHLILVDRHRPLPASAVIDAVDGQRFLFVRDDSRLEQLVYGLDVISVTPSLPLWPAHVRLLLQHRMRALPATNFDVPEVHRGVLDNILKAATAGRLGIRRATVRPQPGGPVTVLGLAGERGFGVYGMLFETDPRQEVIE